MALSFMKKEVTLGNSYISGSIITSLGSLLLIMSMSNGVIFASIVGAIMMVTGVFLMFRGFRLTAPETVVEEMPKRQ